MEGRFHFIQLFTLTSSILQCLVGAETNITTDESALMALKTYVTSDPYGVLANWTLSSPVCGWVGVSCGTRHQRVTGLNISSMGLAGVIPPHLGNLSFLVSVDMRYNYLMGTLPQELSRLRRLRFIRLGYNSFTGTTPSWFGLLPRLQLLSLRNNTFTSFGSFLSSSNNNASMMSLEILDISFNSLQGHIPESIGTNLRSLKRLTLEGNMLSGSIPSSITNMSDLETLNLRNNLLQGTVPEGIGNLGKLSYISIEINKLVGSIPLSIFNISTLGILAFSQNSLSGPLPNDICVGLPLLQGLYLSGNWLNGHIPSSLSFCRQLQTVSLSVNNFSGTIPPNIGSLEMLERLYLGYNELTGPVPSEIGKLQNLQFLHLSNNLLTGPIPSTIFNLSILQLLSLNQNKLNGPIIEDIGNLTILKELYLAKNDFTGVIPGSITQLRDLEVLDLANNRLTGQIPSEIFNISTLRAISLATNSFSGNLPADVGSFLPNLAQLYLGENSLHGPLPNSILNSSNLIVLDLPYNKFSGPIPSSLGDLQFLQVLNLYMNNFTSESTELSFITSLANSKYLTELVVSYNPLHGTLPPSLGNLSSSLQKLYVSYCNIKGDIPIEISNLSGLVSLYLEGNELSGFVPRALHGLSNLQRLYLGNNRMRGIIPDDLCKLNKLGALYLNKNQLMGSIPECLGNVSALRYIHLESNILTSGIPDSIWDLQDLLELDISSNSLTGSLSPAIGNLESAVLIDLSMNRFSNDIPSTLEGLQSVTYLSLAYNVFEGPIPESIGSMLSLVSLNLSHNHLSGNIPSSLEKLVHLQHFNVSFNELSGEIPTGGPFSNFTSQSFAFNTALCGPSRFQVPSCPESVHTSKKKNKVRVPLFILLGIGMLICLITIAFTMIRYHRKKKPSTTAIAELSVTGRPARISYYELLQATDGYGENNLLGRGSFGSVYKGVLRDGTAVAVKVIDMHAEGALKTFDVECEVLRNVRHRNLTKVISSCSNLDFRAIILEYMPNGSLEKWLHSDNYFLDMMQRFNIMMDVASALEYLHYGYSTPVIHCDLKPGNILIDEQMVGHVSDFGMTRFLSEEESMTHTRTLATLGYMAPEYGSEGVVSTRCDVYSYGIVLLEMFTRRRPSDEMFGGEMSIKKWVQDSLANNELSQVIDADLISQEEESLISEKLSCLSCVLELGLSCLADSPGERMSMKDVLEQLNKIKSQFTLAFSSQ